MTTGGRDLFSGRWKTKTLKKRAKCRRRRLASGTNLAEGYDVFLVVVVVVVVVTVAVGLAGRPWMRGQAMLMYPRYPDRPRPRDGND
jgi:hypothetical protein